MAGVEKRTQAVEERMAGEDFKPFLKIPDFTKTPLQPHESEYLFTHHFQFKGVPISISVMTEDEPEKGGEIETPLGEVRSVRVFGNRDRRTRNSTQTITIESPLTLGIDAEFSSVYNYREVGNYLLEIDLGKDYYYLMLRGEDEDPRSMENSIQNGKSRESKQAFDYNLKDKNAQGKNALLPFNPELIRNITVKIVERNSVAGDFS